MEFRYYNRAFHAGVAISAASWLIVGTLLVAALWTKRTSGAAKPHSATRTMSVEGNGPVPWEQRTDKGLFMLHPPINGQALDRAVNLDSLSARDADLTDAVGGTLSWPGRTVGYSHKARRTPYNCLESVGFEVPDVIPNLRCSPYISALFVCAKRGRPGG